MSCWCPCVYCRDAWFSCRGLCFISKVFLSIAEAPICLAGALMSLADGPVSLTVYVLQGKPVSLDLAPVSLADVFVFLADVPVCLA